MDEEPFPPRRERFIKVHQDNEIAVVDHRRIANAMGALIRSLCYAH